MQDKELHIDKKLIGRGWQEMHKLLDEEMPVQQTGKRRFVAWMSLGAIALLVGAAILVYCLVQFEHEATPPPVPTTISDLPIAEGEKSPGEILQNNATEQESNSEIAETSAGAEISRSSFLPKKKKGRINNLVPKTAKTDDSNTSSNQVEWRNASSSSAIPVEPNIADEVIITGLEKQAAREFLPLEKLATLSLNELKNSVSSAPPVSIDFPETKKINWSIYGTGMSGLTSQGSGLGAGTLAAYPLKNSRFTLEAGLGYSFVQQPVTLVFTGSASPNSLQFDNYSVELGDQNLERSADLSTSASAKLVKPLNLHYIYFPVQARYRVTSRMSIHAGVNNGLLIYTSSEYAAGGLVGSDLKALELDAKESQTVGQINRVVTARLNDYDFATTAGIGFDVNSKLSMEIEYQAGLSDLIKNNLKKDYNRLATLTFRYRLNSR